MAETKWTKGPWRATADEWNGDGPADADMAYSIVGDNGWFIAEVWGVGRDDVADDDSFGPVEIDHIDDKYRRMSRANAHLIAAAPDLYAALEVALEPCERGEICPVCDEQPHREDCMAVAALAKARGEA